MIGQLLSNPERLRGDRLSQNPDVLRTDFWSTAEDAFGFCRAAVAAGWASHKKALDSLQRIE
jgi:hypothetical protein